MGRRALVELLHIVLGVALTALIATLAAWSVPNAEESIWRVALGSGIVVVLTGVSPLRAALQAERARSREHG